MKTSKELKIDKNTNIAQLVFAYPDVAEIFMDYGLHCVGCFASAFDTIEQGAKVHQMSDEEIDELIERLQDEVIYGQEDQENNN